MLRSCAEAIKFVLLADAAATSLLAEDAALPNEPPGMDAAVLPDTEPAAQPAAAAPAAPQLEYRAEPVRTVQPQSPPADAAASAEASAPAAVGLPVATHVLCLRNIMSLASAIVRGYGRSRLSIQPPQHAMAHSHML